MRSAADSRPFSPVCQLPLGAVRLVRWVAGQWRETGGVNEAGARFELGTDGPTVILTGVDGSRTSLRAGAYAAGLARRQGARLVVVYVRSGFAAIPFAGLVPDAAASVDAAGREVGEELALERAGDMHEVSGLAALRRRRNA